MKKELFEEIIGSLEARRDLCQKFLGGVYTTEDLKELSLAKAAELKRFCVKEVEVMTKICMVDLYHVIGMGNLTPPQMMKFTYTMQDYLSYRPAVKVLAQKLDSIESIPKLPVKTRFKLLELGNATLTYGEGDFVDEASVDDYTSLKKELPDPPADLPFTISCNQIKVNMDQLDYFIELMEAVFNTSFSVDNLKKKIDNFGEYLGIKWVSFELDRPNQQAFAIGNFSSSNVKKKIVEYYNKK